MYPYRQREISHTHTHTHTHTLSHTHTGEGHVKMKEKVKKCSHKLRNAGCHQKLEEERKGFSTRVSRKCTALLTP